MIDKFNPYATLWPWIREAPLHPENNRDDAEDEWHAISDSSDIIDCRHVMAGSPFFGLSRYTATPFYSRWEPLGARSPTSRPEG